VTRTILLFHIISARPPKQPRMVGRTLGVYDFGLIFVSARNNKTHHHPWERTRTSSSLEGCLCGGLSLCLLSVLMSPFFLVFRTGSPSFRYQMVFAIYLKIIISHLYFGVV
jgi:hypothetical protein